MRPRGLAAWQRWEVRRVNGSVNNRLLWRRTRLRSHACASALQCTGTYAISWRRSLGNAARGEKLAMENKLSAGGIGHKIVIIRLCPHYLIFVHTLCSNISSVAFTLPLPNVAHCTDVSIAHVTVSSGSSDFLAVCINDCL